MKLLQVFRMILEYKEAKYVDKQYANGDSFAVPDLATWLEVSLRRGSWASHGIS